MPSRFERALTDLVGGFDGGYVLWAVMAMRLEQVAGDARDRDGFRAYPAGAWNRLLGGIDDALRTGELAVDLEQALAEHGDARTVDAHRGEVAELLLARARDLADARLNTVGAEWEAFSPRRRRR